MSWQIITSTSITHCLQATDLVTNFNFQNITKGVYVPLLLCFLFSCDKENSDIGAGFTPSEGNIASITLNLDDLTCRTTPDDSLRTDSLRTSILGVIDDPIFGQSKASLIVQPRLLEFGYDFGSITIDSVELVLKFDKAQVLNGVEQLLVYGDLNSEIDIDVYRLDEDLEEEKAYYSNFQPVLGDKIGSFSGSFNFFDSVLNNGVKTAPEFRVKLDQSFGQDMLNQPPSVYGNETSFLTYLPGLVLIPRDLPSSGPGVIVGIKSKSTTSRLILHYKDSLTSSIPLQPSSEAINFYELDNQPVPMTDQFSATGHYDETYLQALGGGRMLIDLVDLEKFIEETDDVVINEAKMILQVDQDAVSEGFAPPARLLLFRKDEAGENQLFVDLLDHLIPPPGWTGFTNYGGEYNSDGYYEFHFNRYLQELIRIYKETGENAFHGFILVVPSDLPLTPARAVMNTTPQSGISVSVTYTKLN